MGDSKGHRMRITLEMKRVIFVFIRATMEKNMNAALLLLMIITKQSIRNTEVDKMEYN